MRRRVTGKRLAQRDILQAKSAQILAKGEIPILHFSVFAPRHRGQSRSIMPFGHDTGDSPRCHGLHARRQCACGTVGRDILRAKSAQILAKGEIPVIRFSLALLHQYFFCFSINTGRHPMRMAFCCIFVFYASDPQSDSRFVSRIPTPMNRSVRPG